MAYNETEIDNALVRQKDRIIDTIDGGHTLEALKMLALVWELWKATDYEYKFRELIGRLNDFERNKTNESFVVFDNVTNQLRLYHNWINKEQEAATFDC